VKDRKDRRIAQLQRFVDERDAHILELICDLALSENVVEAAREYATTNNYQKVKLAITDFDEGWQSND